MRKVNGRLGKAIEPIIKEVKEIGNDVKDASKETIEQSKKAHQEISKLKGVKRIIGYSIVGTAAVIVFGVPGVLTAIVAGKLGWKYIQRKKTIKKQREHVKGESG